MNLWELFVKISGDNSSYKQAMKESEDSTTHFGSVFDGLDKKLGLAIGFTSIGTAAFLAAEKFEDAGIRIQRSTGATGDKLAGLQQSMSNLFVGSAKSVEDIGGVLSQLTIRTGLTGDALESLAKSTLNFAKVSGSDLQTSVTQNERLFAQWGITTKDQAAALDVLYVASQKTGASTTQISTALTSVGPTLRAFGYDFVAATALVGTFEKAGLDASEMMRGLNALFIKAKDAGKNPQEALAALIIKMEGAKTSADAVTLAIGDGFTKRGAIPFADAVRLGSFEVDSLTDSLTKARGEVDKTAAATTPFSDSITKLSHSFEDLIKGPATDTLKFLQKFIDLLNIAIPKAAELKIDPNNITPQGFSDAARNARTTPKINLFGGAGSLLTSGFASAFGVSPAAPSPPAAPVPISTLGTTTPPPTTPPPLSDDQIKKLFSTVGMEDYRLKLAEITKAFGELNAAGLLTVTQQEQVRAEILKIRDAIADYQKPFLALANAKPFEPVTDFAATAAGPIRLTDQLFVHLVSSITGVDEALVQTSWDSEKAIRAFDGFPRQFFGTAAYDQLTEAGKRLDEIGGYVLKVDPKHLEDTAAWLQKMGAFGALVPPEMDKIVNALKTLGVSNARDDVSKLNTAFDGLNLALQTGAISQGEYNRGFVNYVDDLEKEGVQIDANTLKVYDQIKAHQENLKAVQEFGAQGKAIFKGVFEGVESDFAGMVTTANFSLDAMAKTGQKFAQDFLAMMLKSLFQPLETAFVNLGKQIGNALGGIFAQTTGTIGTAGGGMASAASGGAGVAGSASSVAGTAASAAASSLTGTLGAIGSIGSFITGVVGDIQNIHTNNLLGEIEVSTRGALNELLNARADQWTQYNGIFGRMGEMWRDMRDGFAQIKGGGGSGNGGASSNATNNFYFYGASLDDITRELKLAGVLS